MKKPTAYAILERLCRDGYVTVHIEQEGNRPARKVYSITPQGETVFLALLRTTLARADRLATPGDIGIMFLTHLPRPEACALLQQRMVALDEQIAAYERAPRHEYDVGARLAIERILTHLHADRAWLAGAIHQFSAEI